MSQSASKTKGSKLTLRQKKAVPILASAASVAEAARLSNVDRRTLHRWLKDEDFRNELAQFHGHAADLASIQLQGLMLRAVRGLDDLLDSPRSDIRLRAIRTAVQYSVQLSEIRKLGADVQSLINSLPLETR